MRTVKASEVVKGMTVQVMTDAKGVERVIRGEVREVDTVTESTWITFVDNRSEEMHANHTVTVLAEPEPEWVDGAWYRLRVNGNETIARRVEAGWVRWGHVSIPSWEDSDLGRNITVLGRVLIVDWPGGEHASELVENYGPGLTWDDFECSPLQKVADAIRTQGGVR